MSVIRHALLVCFLFGLSGPANADANGAYRNYGLGTKSCGAFVEAKDSLKPGDIHAMLSWAQGYLTAYNYYLTGTYSIMGNTDAAGVEVWLYNYCKAHPLENWAGAVDSLVDALRPNRAIKPPM
jgi:hypothetical protein